MRRPQLIVYENPGSPSQQIQKLTADGTWLLGQVLEPLARQRHWLLREPRQHASCSTLLRQSQPNVLVLKLDRKPLDELTLLAEVRTLVPETPVVAVHEAKPTTDMRDHLQALAYDLGAHCVLFPPLSVPVLEEVVVALMESCSAQEQSRGGLAHP